MLPAIQTPSINTGSFNFGNKNLIPPSRFKSWRDCLQSLFPDYVDKPFGKRHIDFWEWIESIDTKKKPRPFIALWPRGGAKSTSAEMACVRIGNKRVRKYIWYVSSTQDKADKHVETIGAMLESSNVERYDQSLSSRKLGKYGHSKGWRRSRLRTDSGLTIDALGLDTGTRGAKIENQRPDFIIFDDVDEKFDTPKTTQKKIETITTSILPAGSSNCAVLFIQNLIHENSIASQLADGRAEFLMDRIVSGSFPAVDGLVYEQVFDKTLNRNLYKITGGISTWEGQSVDVCQSQMNEWGLTAFLQEAQHQVTLTGGIWDHIEFRHCTFDELPDFVRGCVWCDPAVTSTDDSCANGIIADGLARDGTIYRLFSWEAVDSPMNILKRSIRKAIEFGFNYVGVETNQGGDLWFNSFDSALNVVKEEMKSKHSEEEYKKIMWPGVRQAKAGTGTGGKVERNQRMLVSYEKGNIVHVIGTHEVLERSLKRFPNEPLDLADAAFWGWNDLTKGNMTSIEDPFSAW